MNLSSYTSASQRLLEYAELNKSDSSFAGEIVYIFDTAVLESYWMREPHSVGGRYGTDALLTPDVAAYSGWLALKFLVESTLPKQKNTGFVSASHWNEALERVQTLESKTRLLLNDDPDVDVAALQSKLANMVHLRGQPRELLREAERRNIGAVFTKIMQAVSYRERIRRVFINGRNGESAIRDLNSCEYYWGQTGPRVRHQDFRRWHTYIARHRKRIEHSHGRDYGRTTRNVESDAMTLASIQSMYRNRPETGGKDPTLRFVLVTADAAIHDAYADLQDRLSGEGIPPFLRHPHTYSPLLNMANMAQEGLAKEQLNALRHVFWDVEQALEPLLLDYDLNTPLSRAYLRQLQHFIGVWSRSVETICLANSDYILSDTGGDYVRADELARILSTPDVREAAASAVSSSIKEIRDGHLQVMSLVVLESLERARGAMPTRADGPHTYRAPVKLIGVDLAGVLGYLPSGGEGHSAWLDALLVSFHQSTAKKSAEETLTRVASTWTDPQRAPAAQLLASCIFFAANEWEPARLCAELCQARIRSRKKMRPWLREARYCEALAIRMQLRSRRDVRRAFEILTQNIADNPRCLSSVRDRVERATLILTASIVQTIEDYLHQSDQDTPFLDLISRDELASEFEDALANLDDALRSLPQFPTTTGDVTAVRIKLQAEINRLGALLYARIIDRAITTEEVEEGELGHAHSELLGTLESNAIGPSLTAKMYLLASRALLEPSATSALNVIVFLDSKEVTDAAKSRPDEREMKFLHNYFARQARVSLS